MVEKIVFILGSVFISLLVTLVVNKLYPPGFSTPGSFGYGNPELSDILKKLTKNE